MKRNLELIRGIYDHSKEKVLDLLNEKKYNDLAADINYQPNND